MSDEEREKVIEMLKQILIVEDEEIKDYAIESLIDMLEDNNHKLKRDI